MRVIYPLIPDYYPIWVIGKAKPIEYRHSETMAKRETPDYSTWVGNWGTKEL